MSKKATTRNVSKSSVVETLHVNSLGCHNMDLIQGLALVQLFVKKVVAQEMAETMDAGNCVLDLLTKLQCITTDINEMPPRFLDTPVPDPEDRLDIARRGANVSVACLGQDGSHLWMSLTNEQALALVGGER